MYKIFICLVALVAVAVAQHYGQSHGHEEHDHYVEPHYQFFYEVHDEHTGDIKSHKEERKGEHTQGVYSLVEPDGSKRTVEYQVEGKSGFNAKVQRDKSTHPSSYGHASEQSSYGHASEQSSYGHSQQSSYGHSLQHQGGYQTQSHNGGYQGHGASSSVKISTHGANIHESISHVVPQKSHY